MHCELNGNASAVPHRVASILKVPGWAHVMGSQMGRAVKAGKLVVSGWGEGGEGGGMREMIALAGVICTGVYVYGLCGER